MARGKNAGERTVLDEQVLVVDDRDVLLGQVLDLPVLHFPQLFGDLGNQPCMEEEATANAKGTPNTHVSQPSHSHEQNEQSEKK